MQKYGLMANAEKSAIESPACLICDDPHPAYQWTDYSGEGVCLKCGTCYQLKWGELKEGETYPRINVRKEAIPMLRRYWQETKEQNGCGCILCDSEYPEIIRGRIAMNAWWKDHKHEYPEFAAEGKE